LLVKTGTSYNAAMQIEFFDDPLSGPKPREDVRFEQLGHYVFPEDRRVAVGFRITPFRERPSILVTITDEEGQEASSLRVIETQEPSFTLHMHLRDKNPRSAYRLKALLYYASLDGQPVVVDRLQRSIDMKHEGEQ
jgi:hypothetical protein